MVVLPAPVGPTMAIFWPGLDVGREVMDDDLIRLVAKVDVVEFHPPVTAGYLIGLVVWRLPPARP